VINHEHREKKLSLPWLAHEYLGNFDSSLLELEPYGVAVLIRFEKEGSK
jgi:hypothetical protein